MLLPDVAAYLETAGVGTVVTTWTGTGTGSDIFTGQMPADCDEGLLLSEFGGAPPEFDLGDAGVHYERPLFQVYCRHTVRVTGRALIEAAYVALASVVNQTLGSTKYLRIEPIGQPAQVNPPQDAQGRWEWFANFHAEKATG